MVTLCRGLCQRSGSEATPPAVSRKYDSDISGVEKPLVSETPDRRQRPLLQERADRRVFTGCFFLGSLISTVTYAALRSACFLSGNPGILIGVDHSFSVDSHRSGIAKFQGTDVNHFDPDYFSHGDYWGLPDLKGSEIAYEIARRAFEDAGREVLDATIGGRLQVFLKISIDEAVTIAQGANS